MSIWGKIIGGTAGLVLGGPLGAIIGAAAGHAYDKYSSNKTLTDRSDGLHADPDNPWDGEATKPEEPARKRPAWPRDEGAKEDGPPSEDATRKIAFTIAVIVLGAKIAKADGRVTRNEVKAFREVFRVPEHETKNVARVFNQARKDSAGFEPYARQVGRLFANRPAVLEELLSCLFHIAKADGAVADAEIAFLLQVSREMGLERAAFDRIRAAEMGASEDDPFAVLGVPPDADEATAKAAHRKLVREHHPDRLVAQGMPDEFVENANHLLARINAAYDEAAKRRGWT